MLESIRIRNYKSIYDTTLSLKYERKRSPKNPYLSFIEDNGKRAIPLLVIYGANSSGKSTFLDALESVVLLVKNGIDESSYKPSRFLREEETTFSLTAVVDGKEYSYFLSRDKSSIRRETLLLEGKVLFEEKDRVRSYLTETDLPFKNYLMNRILFFNPFSFSVSSSFDKYVEMSGKSRRECMCDIIELSQKLDSGIEDIKEDRGWEMEHLSKDKKSVWLSLEEESQGTRRLFALTSLVLASLSSGAVLIVDEIDVSLHSIVLRNIVSLFKVKENNTKGAQLICSSHNTDLMDSSFITMDEIAVFEKTRKYGSVIERLNCCENRAKRTLREDYLKGRYSGIPFSYV